MLMVSSAVVICCNKRPLQSRNVLTVIIILQKLNFCKLNVIHEEHSKEQFSMDTIYFELRSMG